MERVARLGPVPAFAVVIGGLALAGFFGARVGDRLSYSVMNSIAAVVYLGWPYMIGMTVGKRVEGRHSARVKASLSILYVLAFHVLAGAVLLEGLETLPNVQRTFFLFGWLLAIVGTFYLLWFGASALVTAEGGEQVRLDQCVGTLVQFLFLPIGVLFLQRRVQALLADST